MTALRRLLKERLYDGWTHFLAIPLIAFLGVMTIGEPIPYIWAAAATASLVLRRQIDALTISSARRFRTWVRVSAALTVCANLAFASIAVPLWIEGGPSGQITAVALLASGVLYVMVKLGGSALLQAAALAPFVLITLGLAGFELQHANSEPEIAAAFSSVLFVVYAVALLRASRRGATVMINALKLEGRARAHAQMEKSAKSDFLAKMSHEIRTPANAVAVTAHLLREAQLPERDRERLKMLVDAADRMTSMINNLLDFSKLEAGRMRLERTRFDPRDKLNAAAELSRHTAEEKGLELLVALDDSLPAETIGDPLRLQQIVINLLSNAVKFTEAGRVSLTAHWAPSSILTLEVADTGIGMSPEAQKRVFLEFEQSNAAIAGRFGGSGLGLAISRQLSELLGGELTVRSALGRGSTFRLTLPMPNAAPVLPNRRDARADPRDLAGVSILAADDNLTNRMVLAALLEREGCVVTMVDDGAQAVKAAAEQRFDAVLMDMRMPVMDGLTAAREIRSGEVNRATPIIALTANALPEHERAWRGVGSGFLTKPIEPGKLTQTITAALRAPAPR